MTHPTRPIILGVVAAIGVLVGAGCATVRQPQESRAGTSSQSVHWPDNSQGFAASDQAAIENAVLSGSPVPTGEVLDILYARRDGDWAELTLIQHERSSTAEVGREPGSVLAHKEGDKWNLFYPGTAQYCQELKAVPDSFMAPVDKRYYCP